jgi:hypothetical protein
MGIAEPGNVSERRVYSLINMRQGNVSWQRQIAYPFTTASGVNFTSG